MKLSIRSQLSKDYRTVLLKLWEFQQAVLFIQHKLSLSFRDYSHFLCLFLIFVCVAERQNGIIRQAKCMYYTYPAELAE